MMTVVSRHSSIQDISMNRTLSQISHVKKKMLINLITIICIWKRRRKVNAFSFFPATVRAGFLHHHYVAREDDDIVSVCVGAFEPQKFGANFNLTINTVDGTLCECIICNSIFSISSCVIFQSIAISCLEAFET